MRLSGFLNSKNVLRISLPVILLSLFTSCELFRTMFFGLLYTLTVAAEPGGTVTLSPEAERMEGDVYSFREGSVVTLSAVPSAGYRFTSWGGDVDRTYGDILELPALGEDMTVSASFSPVDTAWTVLVYLDGNNDLEMNALADFDEMEEGLAMAEAGDPDITDKIAVIVQFDRASNATANFDGVWNTTRRYQVLPDTAGYSCNSRPIDDLGEVNMGDAASLKAFIEWGMAEYPAEHYALILWNHGGGARDITPGYGTRDVCVDDTSHTDHPYGNLDFCEYDGLPVTTWKDLLDYWYQ